MKKIILAIIVMSAFNAFGSKISSAYKALSIYDYFKARDLFYASLSKNPAEAGYGLATIYYRGDNPFSNTDSAAKYIAYSAKMFKDTVTMSGYLISKPTISALSHSVALKGFSIHASENSTRQLNHYLEHFYFSSDSLAHEALLMRDKLYMKRYIGLASSDSMLAFMLAHPESDLYQEATNKYAGFQYNEQIRDKSSLAEHQRFILTYPKNPYVIEAESDLFQLTAQLHSADSLYSFIKRYSRLSRDEAWKLLYSISVKNASSEELTAFLQSYPDYPYRQDLEREIQWSQQVLYVLKNNRDKYGYIDTAGTWVIKPVFDDASPFREGLASVCRNDSCYFINKSGERTSELAFEETDSYINGMAIVKKQNTYHLMNRSGQLMTQGFEDISPASDNLFVARKNGFYGAINDKAETVIPFSYKKLGAFKNGYAYYLSDKYGLVSTANKTLQARWDWISEIDTNNLVIVKKETQFGLMNLNEQLLLEPEFDYISHCTDGVYLVVKNNLYGFYNSIGKCYITAVSFDYNKAFDNAYYTNGKQFKLIEEEDIALMDANGRISIPFGTYTDVFFAKDDIIRIQKGKKFGYVDRKLKPVSPAEYDKAMDFENSVAIAIKAGTAQLLHKSGKVLYSLKGGSIEKYSGRLYKTTLQELSGLILATGEILLPEEFTLLIPVSKTLWAATKDNSLYIYRIDRRQLIRVD